MKNIVIGIEGTVGAGKTSICRELLNDIENSIILHGGEIYRAIVYGMMQNKIQNAQNLDAFEIMKKLGIEIKLENKETVIYMKEKKISQEELQSKKSSIAVSKVSNIANNKKLYEFGKDLIDKYRKNYNVILSSRDIVKMYPDVTYHFFIDASLEERTNRKYMQYNKEIPKEQIKEMIKLRDELQEKSGYYVIYPQTKILDVTNCKSAKEAEKLVLESMKREVIKSGV
jgi:cytidylate kinase